MGLSTTPSSLRFLVYHGNDFFSIEAISKRPFSKSALICPISASGSNFGTLVKLQRYPRNIKYMDVYPAVFKRVVEIFAFLELE